MSVRDRNHPITERSTNPILRTLFRRPQASPWGPEGFARSQTPILWDQNLPLVRVRGQEFLRLRSGQVRATQAFSARFRFQQHAGDVVMLGCIADEEIQLR